MKYLKGIVGILVLIMIVLLIPVNRVEASAKKYLVLIQNDNNTWTAYDDLTEVTSDGFIMLKAKPFSEIMNFTYVENTKKKQFSIKRSKTRYNTYTLNNTKYIYSNKANSKSKKANYKSYKSKKDKYNLCIAGSVNTLCNFNSFIGNRIDDYKQLGYDGVLCYSSTNKISNVPNILYVRNTDGSKLKKRLTSDVMYADVAEDGYINITLLGSTEDYMDLMYQVGDEEILSCSWGEFNNDTIPLYVKINSVGITYINVILGDYSEYITILINVISVPGELDSISDSISNLPVYLTDNNYSISGVLTSSKSTTKNRYSFNGTITNTTNEEISLGSYTLYFNSSNGRRLYSQTFSVLALQPNMSQPISCFFTSDKECTVVLLDSSTAFH